MNAIKLLLCFGCSIFAFSASAQLLITEFLTSNSRTAPYLENGVTFYEDWIEIQNVTTNAVNLAGWSLTDSQKSLRKWTFPSTNLGAGQFMIVYASGRDRRVPGLALHTNFKLDNTGEYLGLVNPGGDVVCEFAPTFPPQVTDVSYGLATQQTNFVLLPTNAAVRAFVPTDGGLGASWNSRTFDDSGWISGVNGVGFDTGAVNPGEDLVVPLILASGPVAYWRLNETTGTTAANLGSNGVAGTYKGTTTLGTAGPRPPTYGGYETDNNAPQFDGSSGYVTTGAGILSARTAFCLAGWVKPAATPGSRVALFGQNDAVEFGFDGGGLMVWTAGGGSASVTWTLPNNQWYHVAVSGDGTSLKLYTNGVLAATGGSSTSNYGTSSDPLNIGAAVWDAAGNYFNGAIDEVAVWTRALSAAEIQAQYQAAITPTSSTYSNWIGTDLRAQMSGKNSTAYIRYSFMVTNPVAIDRLTLNLKYDDGFVAYLNGALVAWRNAPADPQWNSAATNYNGDANVLVGESFNLTSSKNFLQAGTNVLAIQGLNSSVTNSDFLIYAELTGLSVGAYSDTPLYFTVPTPGTFNGSGTADLGPVLSDVGHVPAAPVTPATNDSITVTARIAMAFAPVTNATLFWRVMWGATNQLPMFDDGLHGDGAAGDGMFGAVIPPGVATNGQMVRWFIRAWDSSGRVSRWPIFANPLLDSEYEGTMMQDPAVSSQLQVWHFFINPSSGNMTGIDTESGGYCSMFYAGKLYDNVYMELRGNTTAGYPKKSHRLEFPADNPLDNAIPGMNITKTSLLSETADPAYLRTYLSFWLMQAMGVPSPFHYPVHCRLNGQFWGLWFHNDVIGGEQLARMGYDPLGALYKAAGTATPNHSSTGGFEKKTRLWEGTQDFDAMANAINESASLDQRRAYLFDNFNLPEVVNYLATARWTQEADDVWANMSLYRDTLGTGEWFIVPFDLNVSWGQLYCGDNPSIFNVVMATNDTYKSHPLYGGSQVQVGGSSSWNRVYDVIIAVPEARQMLLRRERTLIENFVQPPGTPFADRIMEQHVVYMTNLMWPEMLADRAKNGWPCGAGTSCGMYCWGNAMPYDANFGAPGLITKFVEPRRGHFWGTHCITNTSKTIGLGNSLNAGIPTYQPSNAVLNLFSIDYNPASGNQAQEFLCLTNPSGHALDITGWRVAGGVDFTFKPGTVIPSNSAVYVSPDVVAFRARATGPRGGQGLFVVGPYKGQLSARGETLVVYDAFGREVSTNAYPGSPSLAQQYLRITELMYNPVAQAGNTNDAQEFEYIELRNTSTSVTLNLDGVHFTNGIEFAFAGSAVSSLAPGERVLVVKNASAFALRYGSGLNVAGQYGGYLNNGGERVVLVDAFNEEILDFTFDNQWYPITDGLGFSLVAVDDLAEPDAWSRKANWRASGRVGGSPGAVDPAPIAVPSVVVNEALTRTENPELPDVIELYNPTADSANIGGWLLTDDFNLPWKFQIPSGTVLQPGQFVTFDENQFGVAAAGVRGFGLGAGGDQLYLFSTGPAGELTGYVHGFKFDAADDGVTFGRYVTSDDKDHFVAQLVPTLGTNNAGVRVGPVVINEIMYQPPPTGTNDNTLDEFVELLNISGDLVRLFDPAAPANTWHLRGGIDFDFPTNLTLQPAQYALLVNFDPADSLQLSAFRTKYSVAGDIPVFGPYGGKLNNQGDNIELRKPTLLHGTNLAYVVVDKVEYESQPPWPCGTSGSGASLQRQQAAAFGDDPANWAGASPTAGRPNAVVPPGGPVIMAAPADQIVASGGLASFTVSACGRQPFAYQWLFNGAVMPDETNIVLTVSGATPAKEGPYTVIVANSFGSVTSAPGVLYLIQPPSVAQQPQSQIVTGAVTVVFKVVVKGPPPMRYQWRFNGNPLPGEISDALVLRDVTPFQAGSYSVAITNAYGWTLSSNAVLDVRVPCTILEQPQGYTFSTGTTNTTTTNTVTLSVRVAAMGPPRYQWTLWGTNLPGETGSSISIANVSLDKSGPYAVVVSDDVRTVTSSNAVVSVLSKPYIIVPIQAVRIVEGATATFSVWAGPIHPSLPLTYQWMKGGSFFLTNDQPTLVVPNVPRGTNYYLVKVVNAGGSVNRPQVTLVGLPDSDHDGLPDETELALGYPTNNPADGLLDYDGDGMSNADEAIAGTNPKDPASVLRLAFPTAEPVVNGEVRFSFAAMSNHTYGVEYKNTIVDASWSNLISLHSLPTNRVIWLTNSLPPGTGNRFYRVKTPLTQ